MISCINKTIVAIITGVTINREKISSVIVKIPCKVIYKMIKDLHK